MTNLSKNRLNSAWTPLANSDANDKIYNERIHLVYKWYDKWTDAQRKQFLAGLLHQSKYTQLVHARSVLKQKCPTTEQDFTRVLPRCLSLYILSYLDPRSLCRASQVCWYWKILSNDDQLWLPKCSRVGWYLPFAPTPFENGTWKRLYMENIKKLRLYKLKKSGVDKPLFRKLSNKTDRVVSPQLRPHSALSLASAGLSMTNVHNQDHANFDYRPPWKATDPKPQDIHRYNYLNNDDASMSYQLKRPLYRKQWRKNTLGIMAVKKISSSVGNLTLSGGDVVRGVRVVSKSGSGDSQSSSGDAGGGGGAVRRGSQTSPQYEHSISYELEPGGEDGAVPAGCVRPNWATRPHAHTITPPTPPAGVARVSEAVRRPSPVQRHVPKKTNHSMSKSNGDRVTSHDSIYQHYVTRSDHPENNVIVVPEASIIEEINDDDGDDVFKSSPWRQIAHVSDSDSD